jgi:hypothetical protein
VPSVCVSITAIFLVVIFRHQHWKLALEVAYLCI